MQVMIMNYGLGRIPLVIGLCVLATCWCLASLAGCSGTRVVAESKIADGDGKVSLAWDNVADASSYHIYYGEAPGVTKQNGKKIANVSNPHTITGLTRGKVYYFVVTAARKNGESEESEEISFSVE
jgi:fibronectin type 3 domain-containing protein